MNRFFLNDVEFEKKIKLKRPKKPKDLEEQKVRERTARRKKRFRTKLMRLVFFLSIILILTYASFMSCNGFLSVAAGRPVTIIELIQVFMEGFNED